jgi:hypothetical protein
VTSIVNNILYAIDAFGTIQFLDKIKYICRCLFFLLVKSLVKLLSLKINQYHQDQKNYQILKNLQD